MTTHTEPTSHRCYARVTSRYLLVTGAVAVPLAMAARAAAAALSNHPVEAFPTDLISVVQLALAVLLIIAGVTAEGLLEHAVAHWRATWTHNSSPAEPGRAFIDEHGRWWYVP